MLRGDFKTELSEIIEGLADYERRLDSLHDLAEEDNLHIDVVRRLGSKATVLRITRDSLVEIPAIAARQGQG